MSKNSRKASQQIASLAEQMDRDLAAIRRALRRPLEIEIARGELTVPQTAVMRVVVRQPGVSLKNLSRQISLAHSTVSGIVDRLEKQGMLTRKSDPSDGRATCIHPSRPVVEFVSNQLPVLSQGPLQNALDRAAPAERDAIAKALNRLRQLLEAG
jgi:DNA-binding MarR family transcriptional regulator